jgi:hypothetical protein
MSTFDIIWYSLMAVFVLSMALFMFRVHWIHEARMKVLNQSNVHRGLYQYGKLQSFDYMLWRVWIWSIEDFPEVKK